MRWRQVVSLMVILMSATLFTVSCDNGLRPDPNSYDFINSRREFLRVHGLPGQSPAMLLHLVASIDRSVPVIFLDTGKLFGETRRYRDELSAACPAPTGLAPGEHGRAGRWCGMDKTECGIHLPLAKWQINGID